MNYLTTTGWSKLVTSNLVVGTTGFGQAFFNWVASAKGDLIIGIFGLAIIEFIWAAVHFGGGGEDGSRKGKKIILNAVIAIIIAVAATLMVNYISGLAESNFSA